MRPAARRLRAALVAFVAFALVAAGIALGRWQLDRAAQKEALQAHIDAQGRQPPLTQAEFLALAHPAEALHRPVRLRGLWIGPQTLYLDNRQMHGKPGFYVLTPFALEGSDETILVQRGWIQRDFNERGRLQPVETPSRLVDLVGVLAPPPARLLELAPSAPAGAAGQAPGSSPIRQNLDLSALRDQTGLPLRTDLTLQQTGAASEGLQRDWPAPALGIDKHHGYAFQWFGLSALVAILYVWFQFIVPFRRGRRA